MMKRWQRIVIAGSLAGVVGIILPLQTYLGNPTIFAFSFGRLLPELFGLFAIFTIGLILIGRVFSWVHFTEMNLSDYPFALFTAVLVCVYLESGILSAGLPELNGGPVAELANKMRGFVDAGLWALLIVGSLAFARKLATILHWVALAVLALSLAGLVDVAKRAPASADGLRADGHTENQLLSYASQPTVVANVKYSPTRNVLVFVLDSMPGRAAIDILAANGDLCAKFSGFTAYPNNIGMHECTKRGVPGLVTGRHYDPAEMSEADYPMTMYGTNSFVTAAAAAGWNVAFSPDLLPYGAINLPIGRRLARVEERRARDRFAFLRQTMEVPYLSLFDTVAFRLSPFFFKGPILYSRIRHAVKGRHSAAGFWDERTMYPQLAACPVSADTRPFLGFFHSWGVHPPWAADFATTVADKFRTLGRFLDACREKGICEKSLVIVTSDHGLDLVPPMEGFPPSASALLMVKPVGASAPFVVSDLQTSHARIAPLVKAALAAPQDAIACEKMLRDDSPLHRAEVREGSREYFKTWRKQPAGKIKRSEIYR